MIAATAGWASGNCSAAAGSGTLCASQIAAIALTLRDDLGRRRVVVPGVAPGEDAGIERSADDDRGPGGDASRQQIVERRLLQQRIAPGQQKRVPLAPFHRFEQDLALVDADPDRAHRAAAAQFFERAIAALAQGAHQRRMRLRPVLVGADIVHIEDVDPRQPEPLQTVLERAHDPVIGIVVDRIERQRMAAAVGMHAGRVRAQQAADLGREHPFVARPVAQRIADRALGLTDAIERRGIDIAHPGIPGGGDDRLGRLPRHLDPAAAQCRAAETEFGDHDPGAADLPLGKLDHLPPSVCPLQPGAS